MVASPRSANTLPCRGSAVSAGSLGVTGRHPREPHAGPGPGLCQDLFPQKARSAISQVDSAFSREGVPSLLGGIGVESRIIAEMEPWDEDEDLREIIVDY